MDILDRPFVYEDFEGGILCVFMGSEEWMNFLIAVQGMYKVLT